MGLHQSDGWGEKAMVMTRLKPSGKKISYTLPGNPMIYQGREELPNEHLYSVQEPNGKHPFDITRSSNPSDFALILHNTVGKPVITIRRNHFCRSCMSFGVYRGYESYDDSSLLLVVELKLLDNSIEISDPQTVIALPGGAQRQSWTAPTFKVHRKPLDVGFTILRHETPIARVKRKVNLAMLAGENTYTMKVHREDDEAIALSIVAIFDVMKSPSFSVSDDSASLGHGTGQDRHSVHHTCWESHHASPAYILHQRPPVYRQRHGAGHPGSSHGFHASGHGELGGGRDSGMDAAFGFSSTSFSDSGFGGFGGYGGYSDPSCGGGMSSSGFGSSDTGGGCGTSSSSGGCGTSSSTC